MGESGQRYELPIVRWLSLGHVMNSIEAEVNSPVNLKVAKTVNLKVLITHTQKIVTMYKDGSSNIYIKPLHCIPKTQYVQLHLNLKK